MADVRLFLTGAAVLISGCSGIEFLNRDDGHSHPYRVAMPALKVTTDADCKMTSEVISIPGRLNYLKFRAGLGKIDDSVTFEPGGTIKEIKAKQEGVTDDLVKVLGAVTNVAKTAGLTGANITERRGCPASVRIYPINSGDGPALIADQPILTIHPDR